MLQGKKVLIVGMMGEKSIAYGVAKAMYCQGAELGFSCMARFKPRLDGLCAHFDPWLVHATDLSDDQQIEDLAKAVVARVGKIDIIVHSVAYAPKDHLEGDYLDNLTREGFLQAHDISSYTLAALTKTFLRFINPDGAIITLSYMGAQRAMPNYNVMGVAKASLESQVRYLALACGKRAVRVNAVSAGPIRTASAAGVKGLRGMIDQVAKVSPRPQAVTTDEVGQACTFLCSDMASAVTGTVLYVDNGYNILGAYTPED